MAVDVLQQERSQGFILYPKHVDGYPQPVPFASLPQSAGQLPSWEQKKLELEMASAGLGDGQDEQEQEHEHEQGDAEDEDEQETAPVQQPQQQQQHQQQLPKQSSLKRTGSAFFSSFRSPSSARNARTPSSSGFYSSNGNANTNGTPNNSSQNGNSSTVQVHRDPSGGIGTSPRASSKKRSSSLMLYLKKHFGIENHPAYDPSRQTASRPSPVPRSSHAATTRGSINTTGGSGTNKLKKSPSQRLAATSKRNNNRYGSGIGNTTNNTNNDNRKTRSSGFANKMRIASGKLSTKAKQTWRRFNSKSKPEELPKTWEEWRSAYARGQIDISDLPTQYPPRGEGQTEETPFENQYLPAPLPEDHRRRQLAFNRLDVEGKRGGVKPSEIAVPAGEEQLPDTLEGHPA